MLLKTIEIKGFKSFADKTAVHFNKNVTGIVGPNGCGKSNIVDAVRWVLGEQRSKALRSDKMSNIIFNGTKKRKAGGYAEVSLIFENNKNLLPSEYNNVKISRVLHRNGDSNYKLNEVNCRLKDIKSLFLDTGISSDTYAIIELKMIDDILNDQENSRKRLFDAAVGIGKYKSRKKEALQKLNNTGNDLDRVEDILHEIENNMRSFEKQAKRAEKFKTIKGDYKVFSIQLAQLKMNRYNDLSIGLQNRQTSQNDAILQFDTQLRSLEAKITEQKRIILDKEKVLKEFQKELSHQVSILQERENEKNISNENLKFQRQQEEDFNNSLQNVTNHIEELKSKIAVLKNDKIKAENSLDQNKQSFEIENKKLLKINEAFTEKENIYKELNSNFTTSEKKLFEFEKKIAINESQKTNYLNEIETNKSHFSDKENEINSLRNSTELLEKEKVLLESEYDQLLKKEETELNKLEEITKEAELIQTQYQTETRSLDRLQNEYRILKSLIDKMEGFPESIQYLSKNKTWTSNQVPLLSDLINCDESFKLAIENYLEPYLNYYIVENFNEAKAAINLLSNEKKGRANFFILDQIKLPDLNDFIIPAHLQAATEIINYEEKYKNIIAYLLGNVYILNVEDEGQIERSIAEEDIVVLSKNGKYIASKISLSGGSTGVFEGKRLGRAQSLKEIAIKIKKFEDSSAILKEKHTDIQTAQTKLKNSDTKQKVKLKREELNKLNNDLITNKTKLENLSHFLNERKNKSSSIVEQITFLDTQIVAIDTDLKVIKDQMGSINEQLIIAEKDFNIAKENLDVAKEKKTKSDIIIIQEQAKIDAIAGQIKFNEDQLIKETREIESIKNRISQTKNNIEQLLSQVKTGDTDLQGLYQAKTKKEKELVVLESDYFKSKEVLDELDDKSRSLSRNKNDAELKLQKIVAELNDLKIEVSSLRDRISIEFHKSLEDILSEEFVTELKESFLEEKVNRLKRRIENFGDVNPMAIDAYNEIKERFDFITKQKEDLIHAKQSILDTIAEIEKTAVSKFYEGFEKIRANFINVFHKLFTEEDDCDLKLVDPENPLDSKIEIIAKPKGKKPLTINQLSGGEKTLTAISVVFALYLLKPAPFCILDEVDAPLDDANLDKFNSIIRSFSEDSQFIIVTHNKTTMEKVDIIYGVTMQDIGVSSVVPVDFGNLN